ncbi:MAG TPA: glycosyltransferase 87 family protein [Bryocella sp.]|nr:glycosyltransferase 87 family protein [Bryocella sp.]
MTILYFCVHSLPHAWRTLNTDFPNYYLAARLAREGVDTARMYEWTWIQRQKDYASLDIRVVGLLPITPFSTLILWPLTFFGALAAKHIWILFNLFLLIPIAGIVHSLTRLKLRRIALALFLSFPLYRNLLYGQFYIFLLFLILAACISYVRGWKALSAALIAIAGVCKVFPLLLFIVFIRRREWKALASGIVTACIAVACSIAGFGVTLHRVWLVEILPWVMHGEGLGTYTANASFAGILHCLFLVEPQWNPRPWHSWPLGYAILLPLLSTLVFAPAVLLIRRGVENPQQILLEWCSVVTASLAVSSIPASYNFVLLIFPVCVLAAILLERRSYIWLAALLISYLGIGFPLPVPQHPQGLAALVYGPRLPLTLGVLFAIYILQWQGLRAADRRSDRSQYVWVVVMAASVILGIHSTVLLERGERNEYANRVAIEGQGLANYDPWATGNDIRFVRFGLSGYELSLGSPQQHNHELRPDSPYDDLSFSDDRKDLLVERVAVTSSGTPSQSSQIIDVQDNSRVVVENAQDPMLSRDGHDLAFLRADHGRARLMLRRAFRTDPSDVVLTSAILNVYEASFLSEQEYAVAAVESEGPPRILLNDSAHDKPAVVIVESRYPALSPDGRWMAYSHLDHGFWNLWLRDENSGTARRIADVPCNQIQPSWEQDEKTLLYATDCGRSIWFTAIARRRVIP